MKKIIIILFVSGFVACQNEADPVADKSFFTKFYDNSKFNVAYTPLDAVQTTGGGYMVLGIKRIIYASGDSVDRGVIYIMRTDESGSFKSDFELDENFATPAPAFLNVNGKYYFFCSDIDNGFSTQLMEVDEKGHIAQQLNVGGSYPLAAAVDGTMLLLLNYDFATRESRMSVVSVDGHIQKSKAFTIGAGDGPEELIIKHINRTGPQLPFQVGQISGGLYFFNGFYNYTMSTVFTDLSADKPQGAVQGNQGDGSMSRVFSLSGGKFAASRFNYGDNYFLPLETLSTSSLSSSAALGGFLMPELTPNAPVTIIPALINNNDRIIYGSNTRGKQIALFGYNPADGTLIGSKYIGFSNSFELASLTPTSDNGLLVLGTTYIAGRFPRICLFKLSAESLGDSFK